METQEVQHAGGDDTQSAPARSPLIDGDTYRMMVLRFDQPEEEVDEQLVQTALDLDLDVSRPSSPKSSVADATEDVSALDIGTALSEPPETPEPSIQSSSQTSGSSNAHSDSSMEYKRHTKTPSFTATSIASIPSVNSVTSQISNRARVKKGIRRLSTLRRRKPSETITPPPLTPSYPLRPSSQLQRVAMTEQAMSTPQLQPHALTTDEPAIANSPSRHINTASSTTTNNATSPRDIPPHTKPSPLQHDIKAASKEDTLEDFEIAPPPSPSTLEAQHRSLNHPILKKLRTAQLQEQLRFISFQASQTRLMRTAHLQAKRNALTTYKARQFHLENTHADALVDLEHRHLDAEDDLRKGLEAEIKNCDVKLKHMQAYCNPRSHVEGMPRREVTKADYRKLEQQYHIRNTMDNLHTSKINVLRERQGKQLERIMAKQQAELEQAETDFEQENVDLDQRFREEAESLGEEFQQRRKRLVRRWGLVERIERRKIENDSGEGFGKMPEIAWAEEDVITTRSKGSIGSALSLGEGSEGLDANGSMVLDRIKSRSSDAVNIT